MRSLLISSDFPPVPGGQSRYLYDLWSCWPEDSVQVLAPAVAGADVVDARLPMPVVRIRLPLEASLRAKLVKPLLLLRAARRLVRGEGVRNCHCGQLLSAGSVGWWLWRRYGVPYYVYVYGADLLEFQRRRGWGRWLRVLLRDARGVVAVSTFTAEIAQRLGVSRERITVLHPGIEVGRFARAWNRQALRRARRWDGRCVLLSVGRLVQRKGHDVVIRALPRIARTAPAVLYCIAGEGSFRPQLESLVEQLGLGERVRFLGFIPESELPALYAAADVFTMISRELPEEGDVEGFGIVYLEAAAAGLPAVAGRSGGVEDAVSHAETGLLVDDPTDGEAVAGALTELLANEALRARMGAAGRQRVERHFDRYAQAARLWESCS